jgi:2-polyprenyl-3-methyl-5-hydroxy-6-metoxy-1,4-benzoquinol methylase
LELRIFLDGTGEGGNLSLKLPMANLAVGTKLKENYDAYYDGESEWRALGAIDKVGNIQSQCRDIPHATVLDVGSGEGSLLKRLSDLNFGQDLYSVEISQSAVATILQRDIPRLRECQLFDGYQIPYDNRRFDLAIISHVLEHVEHPRQMLHEAARVARHVFVEVPLEDTIRLKPDFVFDRVGHINSYSRKTIRRLIQSCGLEVLSQTVTNPSLAVHKYYSGRSGVVKYAVKDIVLRASARIAASLFTYHCSILCTKVPE